MFKDYWREWKAFERVKINIKNYKKKFEQHVLNIEVESFESLSTSSDDSCRDGAENESAESTVLEDQEEVYLLHSQKPIFKAKY